MPDDNTVGQEIVVSAMRESWQHHEEQLSRDTGWYFSTGSETFFVADQSSWWQGLRDWFTDWSADDDGDGVSNHFDKLNGFDDTAVNMKEGRDGKILAETVDGVWSLFEDGKEKGEFFKITGAEFTQGNPSYSVEVGPDGFGMSFHQDGSSMTYVLERVADPYG